MHAAAVISIIVALTVTGCVEDGAPSQAARDTAASATAQAEEPPTTAPIGLAAPVLPLGRSWTYAADEFYYGERTITVVVAKVTPTGYLLAASAREQLPPEIAWGDQFWFGERDLDLNRVETADRSAWIGFDFPLVDGKTWSSGRWNVTARATQVETPDGVVAGFRMTRDTDRGTVFWEYAPAVAYLTRYYAEFDGVVFTDLKLKQVGRSTEWAWYERGPRASAADTPGEAAVLDVPPGYDAVILSAGAARGGRVSVVLPPTSGAAPWSFTTDASETWEHAILPAHEGKWGLVVASEDSAFAGIWAHTVRWLTHP